MARISRKNGINGQIVDTGKDIFRTAIYLRLSVEDNGKKDADSLENQRELLLSYVADRPYLELVEIYEDNGFTGTDFERPDFQRMLEDAQKGKINCIVVKDLSRLGRNYVEAGNYLEKVFPFLNIRFIAVNDNYDSVSLTSGEQLGATLKNVVNDIYAKDISRKSGSALKMKRVKGEYIGNYAPYGYLKDPKDKNHLIVDPEAAPIVEEIFVMRSEGLGVGTIIRILNEKGYPSPGRLRYERGIITNNNKKGKGLLWNRHVLTDLLYNIAYIGHLAQGKSSSCLHKGIPFHWTDPSEWDIAENTHEPIIRMELWEQVQKVNQSLSKAAKSTQGKYSDLPKRENPYGDLLRCADCGRVIKQVRSYSTSKKRGTQSYYTYKCSGYIELGETSCPKRIMRAADLDTAVLETIHKQMEVFLDTQRVLHQLTAMEKEKAKQAIPFGRLQKLQAEITRKRKMIASLYVDFKDGILSQDEYLYAKETYQSELEKIEQEERELKSVHEKADSINVGERKWMKLIDRYYNAESLTKDMVKAFVKEVKLYDDNSISIEFRYRNEFEELMQECERIRREVA
ncbi:MAG TPA: recombinase family protein [Candidatus Blautia excrementipullorum]|uniref:Recombinase family protein n=1 Tax=Candidatus Egerieisoma faecipullorum TaxID=2840963 RepID=A0A9D1LAR5_9CLOT|nr:recombinase family protein [Candidatus Egerieisoma faecipullorum]HJB15424.1 recombinase family protein [Candidatus Blautia excrementipullorum]